MSCRSRRNTSSDCAKKPPVGGFFLLGPIGTASDVEADIRLAGEFEEAGGAGVFNTVDKCR